MALQEELEIQGNILFKYRGTIPLLLLAAAMAVFIHYELGRKEVFDAFNDEVYKTICLSVCLVGLIIRVLAVAYTPENTSGRNTEEQVADRINITGIYSIVRHPLYLGNFVMWLGIGLLTRNPWFIAVFVLLYWVYYERIMFAEEQFLRKKFGEQYLRWAAHTAAFVPGFGNFLKPDLPFSWKKVLKKEKDGLFAVFLVMYLFEIVGAYVRNSVLKIEFDFWFYSLIFVFLIYAVLKIIKSNTSLLDEEGR